MSTSDADAAFAMRVRTMQIILFAMFNGVVILIAIAVWMRAQGQMGQPPELPMLTYVGIAFALSVIVAHAIVPNAIVTAARRRAAGLAIPVADQAASLAGAYQTRMIVAAALVEGLAFYFTITYLLEGTWPSLVAAIICALWLATKFPTLAGVQRWLEEQQEVLQQEQT